MSWLMRRSTDLTAKRPKALHAATAYVSAHELTQGKDWYFELVLKVS